MCEQNDELYVSFYTDDEDEDDIYGELTPIENWRRNTPIVNFDNMTPSQLIQETRTPCAIGSCCTATAILMNGNIPNEIVNIPNENINHYQIPAPNIQNDVYEELIYRILNSRNE